MSGYFSDCLLEKGLEEAAGAVSEGAILAGAAGAEGAAGFPQKRRPLSGSQAFASQIASDGIGALGRGAFDSSATTGTATTATSRMKGRRNFISESGSERRDEKFIKIIKNVNNYNSTSPDYLRRRKPISRIRL
jgi:hypothetical protein